MADVILSIGASALSASQYGISVTSGNVANADTEGYRLRSVGMEESGTVTSSKGSLGTGVDVVETQRHFDNYLERMFLDRYTGANRYSTEAQWLGYAESVFNQSDEHGLSESLSGWFQSWDDLAADPDNLATRNALTTYTETLSGLLNDTADTLNDQQEQIDSQLAADVGTVNSLAQQLADLNTSIKANPGDASLLDERDKLVRELSEFMDVEVQYKSSGEVAVFTGMGQPLVDGKDAYEVKYEGPKSWASLTGDSTFEGAVYFDGTSNNEITLEVVSGGPADGSAGAATYKVSYDGGKTWLKDADGNDLVYTADDSGSVTIDGVTVWFGSENSGGVASSGDLAAGDSFTIMPKSGVYWYKNTSSFENITPLQSANGEDDTSRMTGGSIAGLLTARDNGIGGYETELDALASTLIWETNFAHSQGAGLTNFNTGTGTYQAEHTSAPMSESGLFFDDKLQAGSFSIATYDATTGEAQGVTAVDFSSINPPGISTFDPAQHSMEDVAAAVNATFGGDVTASVSNGQLVFDSASGVEFQFAGDTTGILAATGVNTYFDGTDASDIALNSVVAADPNRVNAGQVDAFGEVGESGNETALSISDLRDKTVSVTAEDGTITEASLTEYLSALVSQVGADAASATTNAEYFTALAVDLANEQEAVGGVNLDEELVQLERWQRMYESASNMIRISNEMFDTLLAMTT